jgi:glycosyltransferase involved in cell wall biosynthesis
VNNHPKVLLLCKFSQSSSSGITIRNLFKGWPDDRIAVAEFRAGIEEISVPGISRYYVLGDSEIRYRPPFNLFRRPKCGRAYVDKYQKVEQRETKVVEKPRSQVKKIILKIQRAFLSASGLSLVSKSYRISPEFETWVMAFDPDIIYGTAGDIPGLEFLCQMKKFFRAGLAVHIFDDYINSRHKQTLLPGYWKRRLDDAFRQVCASADLHLAISEKMADEYQAKYGANFHAFHNPIDPSIWLDESSQMDDSEGLIVNGESDRRSGMANSEGIKAKEDNPPSAIRHPLLNENAFSFLYAGKINKDTVGPIRQFITAVDQLNAQGHKIAFKIHSPYPLEEIELMLGTIAASRVYAGKLPYHELPAAYRAADGLLLPLDFTEATIRYIRLSMLTKASEYMISGTPIFCFAPKEIAVTEYLLKHDAAIHCGEPNRLQEAIESFIVQREVRRRVAANAARRAQEQHLTEPVGERLRALIESSVEESI